ncbi:MAG: type IV pilin protein [Bacteriovoracia bacterium]
MMFGGGNKNSGFTLIELMIVVGILGLLTTLAKANFDRSASRARQVEAKIALSAIYTVEKTFWMEAGTYSACLNNIGYGMEGTRRYYTIGYRSTSLASSNCWPGAVSCMAWPVTGGPDCTGQIMVQANAFINGALSPQIPDGSHLNNGSLGTSGAMDQSSFHLSAVGNIHRSGSYSAFRINDLKEIEMLR